MNKITDTKFPGKAVSEALCKQLQTIFHTDIPISKAMGIEVVSFEDNVLTLHADLGPNVNIHGTAFAGSLYAINALCGWGIIHLQLKQNALNGSIVVANGQINYAKPVQEKIIAICDFSSQLDNLETLKSTGKAMFPLTSVVRANGEVAAEFSGTYAVKLKRTNRLNAL